MASKDVDFLRDVFLSDLNTGEKARIVKVEGAENGYDHLRIYTQSAEQKDNGIVMLYKVYATEETEKEQE